jgi:hypothetical protein
MELTWRASESTSALYAATCLLQGYKSADPRLVEEFAPAVEFVAAEFATCGVAADPLMPLMTGLAASGAENNRQLVEQSILRLFGKERASGAPLDRLAGCVSGMRSAFQKAYSSPSDDRAAALVDELLLRGRPLQELWEARGPGMLHFVGKLTESDVLAERASVVLVYPVVGGHGIAHRPLNTVSFEAVLANPDEQLPETIRLAWLLAQLNLDLPKFAEPLGTLRRERVGALAMIAPVLAAAEYVELARLSGDSIQQSLRAWRLLDDSAGDDRAFAVSTTIMNWWKTYEQSSSPWTVALASLEQMLFP